jgi:hypothetical protein
MRSGGSPLTAVSAAAPVPTMSAFDFAAPLKGVLDEIRDIAARPRHEHALGIPPRFGTTVAV